MPITLHVAGGSFDLAPDYHVPEIVDELESDHDRRLSFRLADGGDVTMHVTLGCDWSVEQHPVRA